MKRAELAELRAKSMSRSTGSLRRSSGGALADSFSSGAAASGAGGGSAMYTTVASAHFADAEKGNLEAGLKLKSPRAV